MKKLALLAFVATMLNAPAAVLFHYSFDNDPAPNDTNRTDHTRDFGPWSTTLSTTGFSTTSGYTSDPVAPGGLRHVYFRSYVDEIPDTATPGADSGSSLSISVQAQAGTLLSLRRLTFNLANVDADFTSYAQAFISTDGGGSFQAVGSLFSNTTTSGTPDTYNDPTRASVYMGQFHNVESFIIRIALGDDTSDANGFRSALLGSMRLEGSVVPEPSGAMAAVGIVAAMVTFRRRSTALRSPAGA